MKRAPVTAPTFRMNKLDPALRSCLQASLITELVHLSVEFAYVGGVSVKSAIGIEKCLGKFSCLIHTLNSINTKTFDTYGIGPRLYLEERSEVIGMTLRPSL